MVMHCSAEKGGKGEGWNLPPQRGCMFSALSLPPGPTHCPLCTVCLPQPSSFSLHMHTHASIPKCRLIEGHRQKVPLPSKAAAKSKSHTQLDQGGKHLPVPACVGNESLESLGWPKPSNEIWEMGSVCKVCGGGRQCVSLGGVCVVRTGRVVGICKINCLPRG